MVDKTNQQIKQQNSSETIQEVITKSANETSGIINNITNYRGLSLAIFGAIIIIAGQVFGSGLTMIVGAVLLIPGILREMSDSTSNLLSGFDKIEIGYILGMLTLVIVLITRTTFLANFVLMGGFTMITFGILKKNKEVTETSTKIEYKFVPRTFKEDQENPVKVSDVFNDMFTKPAPFPISGYSSSNAESVGRRTIDEITSPFS